jgi:hypothetical protein
MDTRTAQLLRALDPLAADLLLDLLVRPAAEKELIQSFEGIPQPTAHIKLRRLKETGLIQQQPNVLGRGQPWSVAHPTETTDLLDALFTLADAVESSDRRLRKGARRKLIRARASERGLES